MTDDIYRCPDCDRPFDRRDKLVDFVLASHEKGHEAWRKNPKALLCENDEGEWFCLECGHIFGKSREMAGLAVVSHAAGHGVPPSPSSRSTRRRGRGSGGWRGVGDAVEGVGRAVGVLFD